MRAPGGLTMVELMVTLAIVGVLLALTAPSARDLIARQRLRGLHGELVTDLQFARAEAMRRGAGTPDIVVQFAGNDRVSCYAVLTAGLADCNCTRTSANICTPAFMREELKVVRITRADGIALAASGVSPTDAAGAVAAEISFKAPLGAATPVDVPIQLDSERGGRVRTTINAMGRPTTCTPDGSMPGVAPC